MRKGLYDVKVPTTWPEDLKARLHEPFEPKRDPHYPGGPRVWAQQFEPGTYGRAWDDTTSFDRDVEAIANSLKLASEADTICARQVEMAIKRVRWVLMGSPVWSYER